MLNIGCHLSVSKGYAAMVKDAVKIGASTFQFFTRNPRGGKAKEISSDDIEEFHILAEKNGISTVLAHAPYTMNAASKDADLRRFAADMMRDDLKRMEYTKGRYYNFHPGSHVSQGVETGIAYISEMLNEVLTEEQSTTVLLETMAGKGSEIGRNFEEIREIIDRVNQKDKLGVCMDTCHVWDGGYDIVHNLDGVLENFDDVIGLDRLKAIHLNDSLNSLGAHKDRHAKIGEGEIGLEALVRIINHPCLRNLPFYLETPNDLTGYAREIKILREQYHD